jgi:hypothetical protein
MGSERESLEVSGVSGAPIGGVVFGILSLTGRGGLSILTSDDPERLKGQPGKPVAVEENLTEESKSTDRKEGRDRGSRREPGAGWNGKAEKGHSGWSLFPLCNLASKPSLLQYYLLTRPACDSIPDVG